MSEETNPELDDFRKQWQEEVSARSKGGPSSSGGQGAKNVSRPPGPSKRGSSRPERDSPAARSNEGASGVLLDGHGYHDLEDQDELRKLGEEREGIHPSNRTEPCSALEHYEKAVEREAQGNLGDSLALYRKAYRLDSGVDNIYKTKYFPPSSVGNKSKPAIVNPSSASPTVPNPAHHSLENKPPAPPPPVAFSGTIPDLIASFSCFSILPTSPDIQGSLPSAAAPCPIGSIPSEILIEILARTAVADIASFARLSLVCKRFAYLIAVEDRLWKEVCMGKDYGFGAMHYDYACTISGQPLSDLFPPSSNSRQEEEEDEEEEEEEEEEEGEQGQKPASAPAPLYSPLTPLYPSYKTMFQLRPRIRFSGCYISTVNYIRPGASTPTQISFNTPVHIVTYYRYLRFFRDGTCISLLTTTEPIEVVHHLTKENLPPLVTTTSSSSSSPSTNTTNITTTSTGGSAGAVGAISNALRGRWKLSPPTPTHSSSSSSPNSEGDVIIETHGIDPNKYIYKLHLSLRSSSGANNSKKTKNNKLVWVGFWSWNILTDDWAEFGLRNDRPFWWSRVGTYGMGG